MVIFFSYRHEAKIFLPVNKSSDLSFLLKTMCSNNIYSITRLCVMFLDLDLHPLALRHKSESQMNMNAIKHAVSLPADVAIVK